jgi:serine/threonine protein kinase
VEHLPTGNNRLQPVSFESNCSLSPFFKPKQFHEIMASNKYTVGNFLLGKTLGRGSMAKVKLGLHKESGFKVAVKIFSKQRLNAEIAWKNKIEKEISIMKLLHKHKNILQLYEVYETSTHLYLILEYAERGELFSLLKSRGTLSLEETLCYFEQLIEGLEYCHSHLICHRDLKLENLLLCADGTLKIADFGLATLMDPTNNFLVTSCGSPNYVSPEVISGQNYDGAAADIWSAGIILYALTIVRVDSFRCLILFLSVVVSRRLTTGMSSV